MVIMGDSESLVLTVPEAAKLLMVSKGSIYNAVKRGELPYLHIGKRIIIPRIQLEKWLAGEVVK
jgi:excisionase family DNA binding protein